jgi:hypothetical protein
MVIQKRSLLVVHSHPLIRYAFPLLDIIIVIRITSRGLFASTVQRVEADGVAVPRRSRGHSDGLSGRFVVLEELSQLLLADLDALAPSGVAHLHHGSKQVEAVGDIGASSNNDEKQEQNRVAQHCDELVRTSKICTESRF